MFGAGRRRALELLAGGQRETIKELMLGRGFAKSQRGRRPPAQAR